MEKKKTKKLSSRRRSKGNEIRKANTKQTKNNCNSSAKKMTSSIKHLHYSRNAKTLKKKSRPFSSKANPSVTLTE
jgi:hypothetical protein